MLPSRFEQLLNESAGKPFVFDHHDMRTMHFDGRFIQSAMRISAPDALLLSYTKAMMAFMLFNPEPQHILMIGLGGGSLAKYCYRHLPNSRITVLELDADVIALRDAFAIADNDDRFQIMHADAVDYINQLDDRADIILHDGFTVDGLSPVLSTAHFYQRCYEALNPGGVLVSNLWEDGSDLTPVMTGLRSAFGTSMWECTAINSYNRIVFSVKHADERINESTLTNNALELDRQYGLAFAELVEQFDVNAT